MEVGDTIYSAEEFEELPNGTVVKSQRYDTFGQIDKMLDWNRKKRAVPPPALVHEFGTEMSGTTDTFDYPAEIIYLGDE